jgi:arylsulfatase A-like enzyme
MVHVVDFFPTLVKLAGGSLEQRLPLDGMDMWNVIAHGTPSPRNEVVHSLPGEHVETGEKSIREGQWKLVGKELYDLSADPAETMNLAAKQPAIVHQLNERLAQLVLERRPSEPHLKIPDSPLLVFGEQENSNPPEWLKPYLDSLPESAKSKKRKK